jgi:hypothetical protein
MALPDNMSPIENRTRCLQLEEEDDDDIDDDGHT